MSRHIFSSALCALLLPYFGQRLNRPATYSTQAIIIACPTTRVLALLQLTTDTTATSDTTIHSSLVMKCQGSLDFVICIIVINMHYVIHLYRYRNSQAHGVYPSMEP